MLRIFVLLLLLANGAYFAWSQGHVASFGLSPLQSSEPQRLQAQIKPEAVRLLNATEAKRVETLAVLPASAASECLQTGLLNDQQASAVRAAAERLPTGSWTMEDSVAGERWIIYMGKYANAEALAKKKAELRGLNITFESLKNPALEPGLSLGVYAARPQANEMMETLAKRGLRTAKVVLETPLRKGQILKLPNVDDTLRAQLDAIKSAAGTAALVICKAN